MKRIKLFICIVTVIVSVFTAKGQQGGVKFNKSPSHYKIKSIKYELLQNRQYPVDFELAYKESVKNVNNNSLSLISFGYLNKTDYIYFINDTIFLYTLAMEDVLNKKIPIFILNKKANQDTIFINNFGSIHNHYSIFEREFYYSPIKDTVYQFKLWYKEDNYFSSSAEFDYFKFNTIGISKIFGFVWINYKYYGSEVEIRYY